MKYYHVAESTFVRTKSVKDGLRVLDRHNACGYTSQDFSEVSADSVHNVHHSHYSFVGYLYDRGCFKLYFDSFDGFPKRAIMDCSRDANIIY